ncbi:substrate-binding periplasmic protein [Cognatishimia activa]|nr:transporter substrate-binding domain-containing protein [Cognatishimia activa]
MKLRYLLITSLLSLWVTTGFGLAETWVVGSQKDVPPFNYFDAQGTYVGIDVDILEEAAALAGVTLAHRPMPWRRALLDFESGQLDAVFQLTPTPERFAKWNMVGPLRSTRTVFITRVGSSIEDIETVNDLNGHVLGTVAGYTYGHEIDEDTNLNKEISTDDYGNVRKLLLGRVDVIVGGQTTLLSVIDDLKARDKIRILPTPLVIRDRFIAFPKDDRGSAMAKRMQTALDELRLKGRIAAIIAGYVDQFDQ